MRARQPSLDEGSYPMHPGQQRRDVHSFSFGLGLIARLVGVPLLTPTENRATFAI
jgi:hypothetical protein